MENIKYHTFAAQDCVLEYKPQLIELLKIAQAAQSIPYLYAPDDAFFDASLGDGHVKAFAFCDGQMVGFSFLRIMHQWPAYLDFIHQPSELSAMVLMNLVHPDYRGLGIGRQLFDNRVEVARLMGVKHLYVTVHPDNMVNTKLLAQVGMKVIAEREVFTEKLLRQVMYKRLC